MVGMTVWHLTQQACTRPKHCRQSCQTSAAEPPLPIFFSSLPHHVWQHGTLTWLHPAAALPVVLHWRAQQHCDAAASARQSPAASSVRRFASSWLCTAKQAQYACSSSRKLLLLVPTCNTPWHMINITRPVQQRLGRVCVVHAQDYTRACPCAVQGRSLRSTAHHDMVQKPNALNTPRLTHVLLQTCSSLSAAAGRATCGSSCCNTAAPPLPLLLLWARCAARACRLMVACVRSLSNW